MKTMNYNGDVQFMRPIIGAWVEESNGDDFKIEINADVALKTLQDMANAPSSTVILLMTDDLVVGFMGCYLYQSPVSYTMIANESLWFVLPKYRGASSLRLLKAAKTWAKNAGATHMTASASKLASDKHDDVCKIYQKTMKLFETTFIEVL